MKEQNFELLYLDDYHAGDVLFVQSLAHSLGRMKDRRVIIVHGSGEHAERALEAEGIFRKRAQGVIPVETAEEHTLVERALRHVNRKVTGVLTDAVVPAVGIVGSDRALFVLRGGTLFAENVEWIERLVGQHIVPVVGVFALDEISGRTGEVPIPFAIEALSRSLHSKSRAVVFTKTNLPGIMKGGTPQPDASIDHLDERLVTDAEAVSYLASNQISVLLTNTTRLSDINGPIGTRIQISA